MIVSQGALGAQEPGAIYFWRARRRRGEFSEQH
jgi:hypothetical protein